MSGGGAQCKVRNCISRPAITCGVKETGERSRIRTALPLTTCVLSTDFNDCVARYVDTVCEPSSRRLAEAKQFVRQLLGHPTHSKHLTAITHSS